MHHFDEAGFSSATYKVLYQIAERATTEETLFEFSGALHRLLAELIPAKNLYLCLLSEQPGRLNFPYYVDERDGDSMQELDVPMRLGLTEFVLRTGVAELIDQPRYLALQRNGEITQATGDLTFNSWLGVPLHIKGKIGGVLTVQSYDNSVSYQASDAHLLSFVARHVSTAIERKQSYDALRAAHVELERETRQRRQSETMYRVFYQLAVRAAEGDSLHDFSARVHELLGQLMLAPNCYISLCDVARRLKHFPYYVDERDGDTLQRTDVPMRLGLTEFVIATGRSQLVDQTRLAQLQADGLVTQAQGDLSFTAWLGVPLHIRGTVDGVLAVQSYAEGAVYTEADAEVLAHVAHHVSGAIERMQAYEAMHRSEERYRLVIENVEEGMIVLQGEHIVFANARASEIARISREEFLTVGFLHRVHPDDHALIQERRRRRLAGENVINHYQIRLLQPDGTIQWLEIGVTVVPWEGQPATLTFYSDITDRKLLEQELHRTSSEREAILNSALVGIVFSRSRDYEWVNDKFAEMVGYSRDELVGQSSSLVNASQAQWEQAGAETRAALANVGTYTAERQLRRKNGELFWAHLAGRCVRHLDPDSGVIWTFLDITGRKQAEQEIRDALDRQKELNELRSRFVAMTSHEFRTPLATILSSAELLKYYGDRLPAHEKAEVIQSIESSVQRMTRMMDRVLLIGKVEAQMLEFNPERVDLVALCLSLAEEARAQLPDSPCVLRTDFADDVGSGHYDEKLLGHIFGNLLSNAIKYSPLGGDVCFRAYSHGSDMVFEVTDNGIGIPADEIAHLFESFHRSSNVGNIQGTGLGLAIVKKSVDLHGGRIEVRSEQGRGTCFTVRLAIQLH